MAGLIVKKLKLTYCKAISNMRAAFHCWATKAIWLSNCLDVYSQLRGYFRLSSN